MKQLNDPSFDYEKHYNASSEISNDELNILFLGTISMKPCQYRSASAIYLLNKGHGILMDSAEGSYGQLYDHFQDKELVDKYVTCLRVVFITHIHGDHQLGILRLMAERDKLISESDPNNRLYVVTPAPMWGYIDKYRRKTLRNPDNVVLVPISDLNPEPFLYYADEVQPYNSKNPRP